jgi:hypothetical protein
MWAEAMPSDRWVWRIIGLMLLAIIAVGLRLG